MSDNEELDVQEEVLEQEDVAETETTEREALKEKVAPVVEEARSKGHISREDWIAQGRDPEEYRTEREYIDRGKFIERQMKLEREIERQRADLKKLEEFNNTVAKHTRERTRLELEQQLQAAKVSLDVDQVAEVSQKLHEVQLEERRATQPQFSQSDQEAAAQFAQRNADWFNVNNKILIDRAGAIENSLRVLHPSLSVPELLIKVEEAMMAEYPYLATSSRAALKSPQALARPSDSAITRSESKGSDASIRAFNALPKHYKDLYETCHRASGGKTTKKAWVERLRNAGEID